MRPITLNLLPSLNRTILVLLLALTFNLSFLARSFEMIHTDAPVLIRIGRDILAILIYAFNGCDDLCCLRIKV